MGFCTAEHNGQVTHQTLKLKRMDVQLQFACVHFGKIQNVIEQTQQRLRRRLGLVHVVLLATIQRGSLHQLQHAEHGVHGGANLMAHIGQKLTFGAIGCVGLIFCQLQLCCFFLNSPLQVFFGFQDGQRHGIESAGGLRNLIMSDHLQLRARFSVADLLGSVGELCYLANEVAPQDVREKGHQHYFQSGNSPTPTLCRGLVRLHVLDVKAHLDSPKLSALHGNGRVQRENTHRCIRNPG